MKTAKSYTAITIYALLNTLVFNAFYTPNNINCGGLTGIAQIINYLIPSLPIGTMVLVFNLPLFLLGFRMMGAGFLLKSLYATAVNSVSVDILAHFYTFPSINPLLACLYGAMGFGATLGLLLKEDATGGGTELGARLLKLKIAYLPIGRICLAIDLMVVVSHALIFGRIENALYSGLALYISTYTIDLVIYGGRAAKAAFIISSQHEAIKKELLAMDMGVTLLSGRGAYSGAENPVLLCAIRRREIVAVKRTVATCDPNAFFIVCDAHEVMGEGFSKNQIDGL